MDIDFERLRKLDGCNVLVKPARPDDPNSVGLRGTVRVHDLPANQGLLQAEIVLSYPERSDMDGREAHEEILPLSQADVMRLLASDVTGTGTYEFRLSEGGRSVE
ncbi:MAG: hypothetical protein K0R17_3578 [Rariglobus sp.]|jgi:hypothetical protein|nr:hypothetical protein [Rariglobus sp.]